ncbi:MAG TPA: hypothetical protein VJ813_17375 [Vicinamibacterales bacterium]|nr:hypothetical protein [Vicinamibacterales bacterium]
MSRRSFRLPVTAVAILLASTSAIASGHGPLFGAATPVLGKGGWSLDAALMGRRTDDGTAQTLRTMIGFGITQDLQISASLPFDIGTHPRLPGGRMMASMSSNREFEVLGAWRAHTRPVGIGGRFETTVFGGLTTPLGDDHHGGPLSPSFSLSAASGLASRAHYFWLGAGHQRYLDDEGFRPSHVTSASVVYGYRPPAWRVDYPKPDVRLFVEVVGERLGRARISGADASASGGTAVFAGPSVLALYKAYALEAGVQFPLYRNMRPGEPEERLRFGVNVAYFFWTK